jgi:hypothetical protein
LVDKPRKAQAEQLLLSSIQEVASSIVRVVVDWVAHAYRAIYGHGALEMGEDHMKISRSAGNARDKTGSCVEAG